MVIIKAVSGQEVGGGLWRNFLRLFGLLNPGEPWGDLELALREGGLLDVPCLNYGNV